MQLDAIDLRILAQLQPSCWDWESGVEDPLQLRAEAGALQDGAAAAGSLLTDKP